MIRWSYLLPRLAVVAAVVLAYSFGLNPLVRWTLIRAGQSITAAKVDLDSARASLARGQITLAGLQVADPKNPMKNLLAADQVTLEPPTLVAAARQADCGRGPGNRLATG